MLPIIYPLQLLLSNLERNLSIESALASLVGLQIQYLKGADYKSARARIEHLLFLVHFILNRYKVYKENSPLILVILLVSLIYPIFQEIVFRHI